MSDERRVNPPRGASRPKIGVWLERTEGASFAVEGMSRFLGFLIEGAAKSQCCIFCVAVPPSSAEQARSFLRGLQAREGVDWLVNASAPEAVMESAAISSPAPVEEPLPTASPDLPKWARLSPRSLGNTILVLGLMSMPLVIIRAMLRPLWRWIWPHLRPRLKVIREAYRHPATGVSFAIGWLDRLPFGLGRRPGKLLRAWMAAWQSADESRSQAAGAREAVLPDENERLVIPPSMAALARKAAASMPVDGWLVLMPYFNAATLLPRPKAVLFPDAIPVEFAAGWTDNFFTNGGLWADWQARIWHLLADGDPVITFSKHVAQRHASGIFGVAPERCHVVPHAPPQLAHLLPFLASAEAPSLSRTAAAEMLRQHADNREWTYLREFPFEEVTYFVVSTQDRPNKNLQVVIEAVRILIRRDLLDVKLIVTAGIHPGLPLDLLLGEHGLRHDVISMPFLPDDIHAALFHCAALAIHPSVFEGGRAPFPFSEAVSVGTPCVMADGPHVQELISAVPELRDAVFNPYDPEELAQLIKSALQERVTLLEHQASLLQTISERNWGQVAADYVAVILGKPPPTSRAFPQF